MSKNSEIVGIIETITARIVDDLVKIVARQERLTFPNAAKQRYPDRFAEIAEDTSLIDLIKTFHSFAGYCNHVPELAHKHSSLFSREHPQYAVNFLPFYSGNHHNHALYSPHSAAIVMIGEKKGGPQTPYLVDPTFKQFNDDTSDSLMGEDETPTFRLSQLNPEMCDALMNSGFCRLTPANAEHYLQCFTIDDAGNKPQPKAMARMFADGYQKLEA